MRRRRPNVLRGLLTGITAGIAATIIMDQFQKVSAAGQKAIEKQVRLANHESAEAIDRDQQQQEQKSEQEEDSTEIVARKLVEATGNELDTAAKKKGGQIVHYTFGTMMGAVYGITSELVPEVTTGGGTAYGTLLFLSADEVAVPAFHLSPPPTETPARDHLQHWAAHVVYGASLELVRSILNRIW